MSVLINADTSDGLKFTSDTSGEIKLQSAGTDIATVSSTGITMASGKSISGGEIIQNAGPAFSAYATGGQSISSSTYTKLEFDIEDFDTDSCYDHTTNYRFTPNVAGYYQVTFMLGLTGYTGNSEPILYKNGSIWIAGAYPFPSSGTSVYNIGTGLVYLNGTTDYIEAYAWTSSATTTRTSSSFIKFQAFLARAA